MPSGTDKTVLAVLHHLIHHGPLSRPELGAGLGLSRATASPVVNDLMRRGLIAEISTPPQGQRGRPVALLDVDDERYAVTGLEIGSDRVLASVHSLRGRQLLRIERAARADALNPRGLMRHAATVLYEALDVVDQEGRELLGVGVSVAGLVDATSGTIKYAPTLGWRDVALQAGVSEALGGRAPVLLDNDANFAALAELRRRRRDGQPTASLVYLTGTYGISAGIITGGVLWRGERGLAGELGSLNVEADGRKCVCGRRGCLDTRAGLSAIIASCLESASTPRRPGARRSGSAPESTRSPRSRRAATRASSRRWPRPVPGSAAAPPWCARCSTRAPSSLAATTRGWPPGSCPPLASPSAVRSSCPRRTIEQLEVSGLDAWAPAERERPLQPSFP